MRRFSLILDIVIGSGRCAGMPEPEDVERWLRVELADGRAETPWRVTQLGVLGAVDDQSRERREFRRWLLTLISEARQEADSSTREGLIASVCEYGSSGSLTVARQDVEEVLAMPLEALLSFEDE